MSEIGDEIKRQPLAERAAQPGTSAGIAKQKNSAYSDAADPLLQRRADGAHEAQPAGEVQTQPYYAEQPAAPAQGGILQRWKSAGGILGAIAGAILTLVKIIGPLIGLLGNLKYLALAAKIVLMLGSMIVSIYAYSKLFGMRFATGFVALIFIHECGHALAARLRGIKTGIMVFVPFMGAFVTTKRYGRSLTEDAFIGIMGPVVGTLASLACALIYLPTQDPFWLALSYAGFVINLFNLLPTPPLDGGWITPLFSPKLLAVGMVIAVAVGFLNPLIWLMLLVSIPRIIAGWKADPTTQPYYQVPVADKWKYGTAYLGLALFLAISSYTIHQFIS